MKSEILQCEFLIPICRDSEISDGLLHEPEPGIGLRTYDRAFRRLSKDARTTTGQMAKYINRFYMPRRLLLLLVDVPTNQVRILRKILRFACTKFAQQCIHLSVACVVELVRPKMKTDAIYTSLYGDEWDLRSSMQERALLADLQNTPRICEYAKESPSSLLERLLQLSRPKDCRVL